MATISSIGTASRTYTTPASWLLSFAAGGWIGECYNDSQFTAGANFSGHATSAADFITLRCGSGQSWRDNASVQTNAFAYDQSKGVGFSQNTYVANVFSIAEDYVTLSGLQIAQVNSGGLWAIEHNTAGLNNVVVENCIIESNTTQFSSGMGSVVRMRSGLIRNCLIVLRSNSALAGISAAYAGVTISCCTIVKPSDFTANGNGINMTGSATVKDTAIFGFGASTGGGAAFSGSNNASDQTIGFGTSNQASKTYSSQFPTVTDTGRDFKAKAGGDILNNGATDTTNVPSATDAPGTSRPQGSAWDIGAWELVVASVAPFAQTEWPNPTRARRADQDQPQGSPDLLTTLAGKDALPGRNYDFPNPRGARGSDQNQRLGTPTVYLAGQDALPGRNFDFPNPPRPRQPDQSQRQGTPSAYIPVLVQAPFSQTDWPNPRAARRADQDQPQGTPDLLTTLAGKDGLPGRNYDFPNPRGARVSDQNQRQGTPTVYLAGQDALPTRNYDFPNPRGARRPDQNQPLGTNPAYIPLTVLAPFYQTDWPNPRAPRRPDQNQPLGTPNLLNLLAGQDALPGRNFDFPNPRGARRPDESQRLGVPSAYIPTIVLAPFNQTDWPNPPRARRADQDQPQGTPDLLTTLAGQDALPGRNYDFPNPRGALRADQNQPQGTSATLRLAGQDALPARNYDFSNPRAPRRADQSQPLGTNPIYFPPLGPKPFAQYDWPNPRCHAQPQYLHPISIALVLFPPQVVASPCNILSGAPRVRRLTGAVRVRILRGGCCP